MKSDRRKSMPDALPVNDRAADPEAVENFVFEASAGSSSGERATDGSGSSVLPHRPKTRNRPKHPRSPTLAVSQKSGPHRRHDPPATPATTPTTTPTTAATAPPPALPSPPQELTPPRRSLTECLRQWYRNTPALSTSLGVHLLILVVLSVVTFASIKQDDFLWLQSSAEADTEVVEFTEIEFEVTEDLELEEPVEAVDEQWLDDDLAAMEELSLGPLSAESALADVPSDPGLFSSDLGDVETLFGDGGLGMAELPQGGGGKGRGLASATFFGTEVEARRILYMLDNSSSMHSGRLETMIFETIRSVNALTPDQSFYVIFYSDTIYPLFYPQPATQFVPATADNKQKLQQWLETVEMRLGNAVDKALEAATAIQPDVVYFLTDGKVNTTPDGRKLRIFLESQGRTFPIHTFGMGAGTRGEFAENLINIAQANGGTYRPVDVLPAMQELAKQKYRNRPKPESR